MKTFVSVKKTLIALLFVCGYAAAVLAQNGGIQVHVSRGDSLANKRAYNRSVISFGVFSPINHHISFGYDQLVSDNMVFSGQLGIIGIGVGLQQQYDKSAGAYAEMGMKLFLNPDFIFDGMHRYNTMQGRYIKPQVVVSVFNQSGTYYTPTLGYQTGNWTTTGYAFILNYGRQWVINNFVIEWYGGIGYYGSTQTNGSLEMGTNFYSFLGLGAEMPIAFSTGINLGVAF